MAYKVVKGQKYYRVDGTDIEDRELDRLAQQMAEDPEIVSVYHRDPNEINMSNLRPEKREQLEYFLRKYIIGEEINQQCFGGEEEIFPTVQMNRDFMKAEFH